MTTQRTETTNTMTTNEKWTEERVLAEARKRTKSLFTDNSKRVQKMLDVLLLEAGWSADDFIDALCRDVIRRNQKH